MGCKGTRGSINGVLNFIIWLMVTQNIYKSNLQGSLSVTLTLTLIFDNTYLKKCSTKHIGYDDKRVNRLPTIWTLSLLLLFNYW